MERSGELQRLRDKFPEIIEPMIKLLVDANRDCENHLHEFAFEFSGIGSLYGRRFNSPHANISGFKQNTDYLGNQYERREKLAKATQLLAGLMTDVAQLDLYHARKVYTSYLVSTGRTKCGDVSELNTEIQLATHVITACQEAYSAVFKAVPKKRGRQPLPYVEATRELMDLWKRLTGKQVPSSKTDKGSKTHKRQITTNAGQFVRLGISIICHGASDANVVTAINNALSQSRGAKPGKKPSGRSSKKIEVKQAI